MTEKSNSVAPVIVRTEDDGRVVIDTIVGERALPADHVAVSSKSEWYVGFGKGTTRDFVSAKTDPDASHRCGSCESDLPETSFPTYSVPRKDGSVKDFRFCRKCVVVRREAKKSGSAVKAVSAPKAAKARKAGKAAKVA